MKFHKWKKSKQTVQEPCVKFGEPCKCGCSPLPFLYVFDGKIGVTAQFESETELNQFKNILAEHA